MIFFYRLFLGLFITLSLAMPLTAQQKYQSSIKGRVVDEAGRPVENAIISFEVPENLYAKFCGAKDFSVLSNKDGNFEIKEHCGVSIRTVFLYTVPPIANDTQATIDPPFWSTLRENNPKFAGLPVTIEANKSIDLGDVSVQIWYNKIELFVFDKNGKPFYKTKTDWSKFHLIVRDESGLDVGSSALSNYDIREKVNIEKGFVRMAFPEGKWSLELLAELEDYDSESGKTNRYLAKTTINISKSEPTLTVHLSVK